MSRGWIGVDLDGTLAHYDHWRDAAHVGDPIEPMVARVKMWLEEGRDVRIFTARVSTDGTTQRDADAYRAIEAIQAWCTKVFGFPLPITNVKDYGMDELYDDRAVQVEKNTGRLIGHSTRGHTP